MGRPEVRVHSLSRRRYLPGLTMLAHSDSTCSITLATSGAGTLTSACRRVPLAPGKVCVRRPGSSVAIVVEPSAALELVEARLQVADPELRLELARLDPVVPVDAASARAELESLLHEGLSRSRAAGTPLGLRMAPVLLDFLRRGCSAKAAVRAAGPAREPPFRRAEAHMREHYDQPMCLSELADMERVAPAYFCRRFREVYGTPPIHYLLGLRVERARELLATSGLTVTDVAERVGFGSVHYFTRYFAKRLGMPPALYRARCRAPRQSAG